jgi:hypothetical protein
MQSYPAGGTAWIDITGNGNNGVLTNGPTFSGVGKQASIVFDGVDDGVNIPHNSNIDVRNQISMECFFKLNSFTPGGPNTDRTTLIIKSYSYYLTINTSGKIDTYFYGIGGYFSSNSSVILNQWTQAVVTFNGTTINWYINGSLDKSQSQSGSITPQRDGDLGIGREVFENYGRGMNGRISKASVYNKGLSAFEVWQNFNAYKSRYGIPDIVTNGLVLNLDAGNPYSYYSPTSGTTWTDVSGNGNNGTLVNGPVYSNGAITFDGINDYVNTSLQTLDRPCTFSVWVNLSLITGWQTFFGQDTSTAIARGRYYFQKANTNNEGVIQNKVNFQIVLSDNSIVPVNSNNVMSINTWYNYTAVLTTTSISLYENGILQNTVNNSSSFLPANTPIALNSGYYNNALVDFVNGKSSNFLVYNRALSADEVLQNFNSLRGRYSI